MTRKDIVRRVKPNYRETVIMWLINAGICLGISSYARSIFWILLFSIVFLSFAIALIRSFYDKVIITDTELIATHYFRTREIQWKAISTLKPKLTGFLLTDHSLDNQVFISAEVINLWEFVRNVRKYRRDLLQPTQTVFHENPIVALILVVAGFFIVFYGLKGLSVFQGNAVQRIVVVLLGLGFVLVATLFWKKFSFNEDKLIVKTLMRKRHLHLEGLDFSSASNNGIVIIAKDGYTVSVENLIEGMPVFLIAFQLWLQTKSGNFHETIQDIP